MTKILFAREATDNLIDQARYIYKLTLDPEKADKFFLTMKEHIVMTLDSFPKIGRPAPEFGLDMRKLVHQSYSIIYRIDHDLIHVLAIYKENLPRL